MTAYLRYGRHEIECNRRTLNWGDSVQCGNKIGFPADKYSLDAALAAIQERRWKIVEPIIPDGGIHLCPVHAEESSVSDSSRVEIDASRDLATIRLRTATGHLYDLNVGWMTSSDDIFEGDGNVRATRVHTWEGIPIPDDIKDNVDSCLACWKRGVTDANNATLNGEPK